MHDMSHHVVYVRQTDIPGRSAKFKFAIPKGASPGELISIALPRGNEDDDEGHNEVCVLSKGKRESCLVKMNTLHGFICFRCLPTLYRIVW